MSRNPPSSERTRAFVAVFPPPEVRETLLRAARELPVGDVRWVRPENVHLTLKFLGDVARDDLARVLEALEPLRERHRPFEVTLSGFGAFPSPRRARVLWAGVDRGSESLRALSRDVESSLQRLGFEPENRPYTPHLTLGRARRRPVVLNVEPIIPPDLRFPVRSVEFVESALGNAGAAYTTLAAFTLSEGRDQGPDGHNNEE